MTSDTPTVAAAIERGELSLHGWYYRFETGEVLIYDDATDKFVWHDAALPADALIA